MQTKMLKVETYQRHANNITQLRAIYQSFKILFGSKKLNKNNPR